MKKITDFGEKLVLITTISGKVLSNLYQAIKIIMKKDINELRIHGKRYDSKEEDIEPSTPIDAPLDLPPIEEAEKTFLNPKNFTTEIAEDKIKEAAGVVGGVNNFTRLLYTGNIFRQEGLEPIYLTNKDETIIRVSAREIWGRPLN